MTLTLDGEGMDSADGIDYSRTAGAMEFEFRAYYADDRKPVVVTNYVTEHGEDNVVTKIVKKVIPKTVTEQLVPLANGVRTGDTLTVTVSAGVLVAGIVIVSIAVKKKGGASHEKVKIITGFLTVFIFMALVLPMTTVKASEEKEVVEKECIQ